jgi:hypothetical protein
MLTTQHSVAANTHESCWCNGGAACTIRACDSYNKFFNVPRGTDPAVDARNDVSLCNTATP